MSAQSKISIIIINYNKPDLTADCVRSILQHTQMHTNYEIIIVDNASTEGDISGIASFSDRIKLVYSKQNIGFAKGNNLGIANSEGEVILLLNNDTVLINDAISIAYDALHDCADAGAVGCRVLNRDGTPQPSAEPFPTIKRLLKQVFRLHKIWDPVKLNMSYPFFASHTIEVDWVWGTFIMFKRKLLSVMPCNKLPDDFFMYAEDLQWGFEIARAGLKSYYVPQGEIYHFNTSSKIVAKMKEDNLYTCLKVYKGNFYCKLYKLIEALNPSYSRFVGLFVNKK